MWVGPGLLGLSGKVNLRCEIVLFGLIVEVGGPKSGRMMPKVETTFGIVDLRWGLVQSCLVR